MFSIIQRVFYSPLVRWVIRRAVVINIAGRLCTQQVSAYHVGAWPLLGGVASGGCRSNHSVSHSLNPWAVTFTAAAGLLGITSGQFYRLTPVCREGFLSSSGGHFVSRGDCEAVVLERGAPVVSGRASCVSWWFMQR